MKQRDWKLIVLLPFFFFQFLFLSAQEIVFHSVTPSTYFIPYSFSPESVYSIGNEILREMAKDLLKDPQHVKISVNYSIQIEVEKKQGDIMLRIFYSNPIVDGDVSYRKFIISDELLPPRIKFRVLWAKKSNPEFFSMSAFDEKIEKNASKMIIAGHIPFYDPGIDTLTVKDIILYYDTLALVKLKEKMQMINDYYASLIILDSLDVFHKSINLEDAGGLPTAFIQVEESDKILHRIMERQFPENLLGQREDFLNLMGKLQNTYRNARSLHFNFLDLLMASESIPWHGDIREYTNFFTSRILSYIRRSQLLGEQHAYIYQDYLDHWFSCNVFPDDRYITEIILAKMYPDANRDTLMGFIAKQLYHSYLGLASELIRCSQYAEAKALMEHWNLFPSSRMYMDDSVIIRKVSSETALGIYQSYLSVASGCLESKKPEMALKYLGKAQEYRQKHPDLIPDDLAYQKVYRDLIFFLFFSPLSVL